MARLYLQRIRPTVAVNAGARTTVRNNARRDKNQTRYHSQRKGAVLNVPHQLPPVCPYGVGIAPFGRWVILPERDGEPVDGGGRAMRKQ